MKMYVFTPDELEMLAEQFDSFGDPEGRCWKDSAGYAEHCDESQAAMLAERDELESLAELAVIGM